MKSVVDGCSVIVWTCWNSEVLRLLEAIVVKTVSVLVMVWSGGVSVRSPVVVSKRVVDGDSVIVEYAEIRVELKFCDRIVV